MAMIKVTLQYLSFFFLVLNLISGTFSDPRPQTFIIHVARSKEPSLFTSHRHWYTSILSSLDYPPPKLLYTYEKAINGFSATLTPSQAAKLEAHPRILTVLPDRTRRLATTRTYKFLGLSDTDGLWPVSNYGEGVVIGILDSGIWPEHRSFSDTGMSPVPSSWKGKCETSDDFPASSCNRKIIGAKTFDEGYLMSRSAPPSSLSARDNEGHGTHVSSTAAGSAVFNASFYGFGRGEARGVAPRARIAMYKLCHESNCLETDILAAMEQAITDGVDIISFSIFGGTSPYYEDNVAIGAFGAMQHGILFSASAGNGGPRLSTAEHLYPWALSVGASSIDREFRADVALGDGRTFIGDSLYYGNPLSSSFYQLVYAGDFGNSFCANRKFVRKSELDGKIIVCEGRGNPMSQADAVNSVNGVGMILTSPGGDLFAEPHYIVPATRVSQSDGTEIKKYIEMTRNATANILYRGTIVGAWPPAPKVAAFSSRGPNPVTPQILKPDVIAPGLNILAAWSGAISPSYSTSDLRRVEFNVISGTSMACPHVSGLAALLKSAHPTWSPAAIKSAIMTTSNDFDNSGEIIKDLATGNESTPLAHGSGHADPNRALDPGLVYDMDVDDYVAFLCSVGYDSTKLKIFLKEEVSQDKCDEMYAAIGARVTPGDLNYPSFSIVFNRENDTVTYRRSLTNVGAHADAIYAVSVKAPPGVHISILPQDLSFNADNLIKTFKATFSTTGEYSGSPKFGSIEWSDGEHRVRSPVAFSWVNISPSTLSSPLGFVATV